MTPGVKGLRIGEYSVTETRQHMAYRDSTLRRITSVVNDETGGNW